MDFLEVIKTRRSIRKYLQTPIEFEKLGKILEAGAYAPSAGNLQNWKFIIVTDPANREKLADAAFQQFWMTTAPVYIVVCAEIEHTKRYYGIRGERLYSIQNCAAAVTNMINTAWSEEIGSCWVSAFDEDMVKRTLDIPDHLRPQAIITLGYPDEKPPIPPKKPIETVAFIEKWGNRIADIAKAMSWYAPKTQAAIGKGKGLIKKVIEKMSK